MPLKIDDETYRRARIRAAQEGTSVRAMVREYLEALAAGDTDKDHAQRVEALRQLYAQADARATPRDTPLVTLTRPEIYAERFG